MPVAFLAILIHTPSDAAWLSSSHRSHSAGEAKGIFGRPSSAPTPSRRASIGSSARLGDHEAQRALKAVLLAQMAVLGVPGSGIQRGGEAVDDALLHAWLEQRPDRLGAADGRVEELLRAPPERLEESVRAVAGCRDSLDTRAPAQ